MDHTRGLTLWQKKKKEGKKKEQFSKKKTEKREENASGCNKKTSPKKITSQLKP